MMILLPSAPRWLRCWLAACCAVALGGVVLGADEPKLPPASSQKIDFVRDVQPLLRRRCLECHSPDSAEGGLDLSSRERAFQGGANGPVFSKGKSAASRLIQLVAAVDPKKSMPPTGERLTAAEVGLLRAWIDQGAAWPDGADLADPRHERARRHWAFQPLRSPPLPAVRAAAWPRSPVDRFVLAKLEAAGLAPSPPADARQLLRRAAFDLVGLPPTPAEFDAFGRESAAEEPNAEKRNAAADRAYEALVDRLLDSRHYGERWGRHWLDVAHYADSNGMESDRDRPFAFPYRDFVIRSLNDDRPFDEFVRWQLAGDELAPQDPQALAATGFLACGPHEVLDAKLLEEERLRSRYNEFDDLLSTVGTGLLGLTLGCARCHDHKYDAISSREYYRLLAAFHSGDRAELPLAGSDAPKTLGYRDTGAAPQTTWLFRRADFYDRQLTVSLGFPALLLRGKTAEEYWQEARRAPARSDSTQQRRALADWITDVEQGAGALLARVIVNRLWQHHFGEPLVATVGDFGVRAPEPTHLDLLEWLADDLVRNGWKLKRLHRLLMTSATYRQTSLGAATVAAAQADPDNRLWSRMRPRRLEAEVLRDAMLEASGTLNRQPYGPAFKPPIAAEAMLARNLKDIYPQDLVDSPAVRRRSVYMFHKRVVPYPFLQAFDKPDAQQSCGRRDRTTVAPQALALLNDPFVRLIARDFAARLAREAQGDDDAQVRLAYRLAVGREPSDTERAAAREFLELQRKERQARETNRSEEELRRLALADLAQAMFSLNEFAYVD